MIQWLKLRKQQSKSSFPNTDNNLKYVEDSKSHKFNMLQTDNKYKTNDIILIGPFINFIEKTLLIPFAGKSIFNVSITVYEY